MSDWPTCELCGEPMPPGEEVFKFHGYSGPCPKPPKPAAFDEGVDAISKAISERDNLRTSMREIAAYRMPVTDAECRTMLHIAIELAKETLR